MALLNASDFIGFSGNYAIPSGVSDPIFTGSVDIILAIGITQQIFDTLSIALKCIHYMEANNLYSLNPNEGVIIINLRPKLLILENTYINQEMMSSYVFSYHCAEVRSIHRSMADMVSLLEALASVGFRCIGLPWNSDSNPKMQTDPVDKDRPRIQVIDYLYKHPAILNTNFIRFFTYYCFRCLSTQDKELNYDFLFGFYFDSNAFTLSCNSVLALIKYAINPI